MSLAPVVNAADRVAPGAGAVQSSAQRKEVAREFESLLLAQVLRGMRESGQGEGWLGVDGDSSLSALSEMAEQLVAQSWSRAGGLGLASMLEKAFQAREEPSVPPEVPAAESRHAG